MLKEHFKSIEESIQAQGGIPSTSGHTLNRGTPREAFIREFLEGHLSENLGIGTGEVIDCNSSPRDPRNQIDIVIYKKEYPKLNFGGGVSGFLAESVVATIEVKSVLDYAAIKQSIKSASAVKSLDRNLVRAFSVGRQAPGILSFAVAYSGPASLDTITQWLNRAHIEEGINLPALPATHRERQAILAPTVDGVFCLGKGFVQHDTSALTFINDTIRAQYPDLKWSMCETIDSNLFVLFLILTEVTSSISGSVLNAMPYTSNLRMSGVSVAN